MSTTSASGHGVWLYACGTHVKIQCRCMENHGSPITTDTPCPTCSARAPQGGPAKLQVQPLVMVELAGPIPLRAQAAILALAKRHFGGGISMTDGTREYFWDQVRRWLEGANVWEATPTFDGIVRLPPSVGGES